ncbi:MAG: efflux RND transporter periplasmic adaptor subunit, partial [Candidatus Manganitrophaceae bacterium]
VRVDAFPAETFSGKLYAIDARVDEATRTVLLRARIPNPNRMLHPGIFARVVLDLGGREKTLFIPEQAIVPMAGEKFVYRIVDGKAMLTKVRIGMRKEGKVEIVEGLGPQETVVTEGQMKLFDGASVTAINMAKPEAKPEEGTKGG